MSPVERIAQIIEPIADALLDDAGVATAKRLGVLPAAAKRRATLIVDEIIDILVEKAVVEESYHEDDIYPPREFLHGRLNLDDLSTDWIKFGDQAQFEISPQQRAAGESRLRTNLRQTLKDLLK